MGMRTMSGGRNREWRRDGGRRCRTWSRRLRMRMKAAMLRCLASSGHVFCHEGHIWGNGWTLHTSYFRRVKLCSGAVVYIQQGYNMKYVCQWVSRILDDICKDMVTHGD